MRYVAHGMRIGLVPILGSGDDDASDDDADSDGHASGAATDVAP